MHARILVMPTAFGVTLHLTPVWTFLEMWDQMKTTYLIYLGFSTLQAEPINEETKDEAF
jgi:threonine/homoserine/homoserine lactone efflux protein